MLALLSLLPRWLVFAAFWYVAGFAYGEFTAYRKVAVEERAHQTQLAQRACPDRSPTVRPVGAAVRAATR